MEYISAMRLSKSYCSVGIEEILDDEFFELLP